MIRALLRAALTEAAEVRSWQCAWCPTMTEDGRDGQEFCASCQAYVNDLEAGIFEHRWEDRP